MVDKNSGYLQAQPNLNDLFFSSHRPQRLRVHRLSRFGGQCEGVYQQRRLSSVFTPNVGVQGSVPRRFYQHSLPTADDW